MGAYRNLPLRGWGRLGCGGRVWGQGVGAGCGGRVWGQGVGGGCGGRVWGQGVGAGFRACGLICFCRQQLLPSLQGVHREPCPPPSSPSPHTLVYLNRARPRTLAEIRRSSTCP